MSVNAMNITPYNTYPFNDAGFNVSLWDLFNDTNSSIGSGDDPGKELWREIPLGIVLTLLCLLTSVGNAMVLYAVKTERRLQSVSNMFIVSLAIADLIVGMFVMPISTVYIFTKDWLFGVEVCQIWIVIDYTASTASILNLFILSLDRYWSVTSPLKYIRKRTKKRAVLMITLAWIMSSLWIIPIIGWHHFFHGGVRTVPSDTCDTEYAKSSALKIITAFFNFYLPLAIMYGLYWKIFQEIRKRSELELGQRNVRCSNSYIPATNSYNVHEDISYSDQALDTNSDNNSNHVDGFSSNNGQNEITLYDLSTTQSNNHTQRIKSKGYFRKKFSHNKHRSENSLNHLSPDSAAHHLHSLEMRHTVPNERIKVEYVYDESVVDEETEKVERYFYEEVSVVPPSKKPSHIIINTAAAMHGDSSVSSPSTPMSSCSSAEDKRVKAKDREKYSLISGLKKIREAESILDTTVSHCKKESKSAQRNVFIFRDRRSRRGSTMLNLKDRIKNIRQSSALTKEIKAARQLGVIMGAFTVCFLPYFVLFLVVAFCDGCIDQGLLLAMTWVGYLNSTLNPFLYPLCNANFRRKFRIMLGLRRRRGRFKKRDGYSRNSITTARYD